MREKVVYIYAKASHTTLLKDAVFIPSVAICDVRIAVV